MDWGIGDFIAAGVLLAALAGGIVLALRLKQSALVRYCAAVAVAALVVSAWVFGAVGMD